MVKLLKIWRISSNFLPIELQKALIKALHKKESYAKGVSTNTTRIEKRKWNKYEKNGDFPNTSNQTEENNKFVAPDEGHKRNKGVFGQPIEMKFHAMKKR